MPSSNSTFVKGTGWLTIVYPHDMKPALLMPIIQYVMPSRNKQLKKLLHFYWEVCPKYDENGKLKQEMILVV